MFSILTLTAGKIAFGVLVAGVAVGGGAGVAASANLLPAAAQQAAHNIIGAPAPKTHVAVTATASATATADATATPTGSPTAAAKSTPVGPDATGPAAFGLCTAFAHGLNVSSTAYASLVSAANGASNIATYCATIHTPGLSATHPQHTVTVPSASATASANAVVPPAGVSLKSAVGTRP
ncbi:MAG: hypothetical protein QOG18_2582 [Microbacteriaceae bacterium]|jgi:hypothetical protein|nr:hypothetical protein [Microbacteriaceae bacterium]MDQ1527969.1 hypothetical protein [Microbacteriaceae bacterium]